MKRILGLTFVAGLLCACTNQEPTLDEFITDFSAAATEFQQVSTAINSAPLPRRTGNAQEDNRVIAQKIRADAAEFDSPISMLEKMRAPSDPAAADDLRILMLQTVVMIQDDLLTMANEIEQGTLGSDTSAFASKLANNMGQMADLADQLGMDSTLYRQAQEQLEATTNSN